MNRPFIITWKSGDDWHGKAIVMAATALQAWEKFIEKWNSDLEAGIADLESNEIDSFTVEVAADEFIA
jgi:hypothetical protein